MNEEEKKRKLDLMEFERNEIAGAALRPGEDEELEALYKKASNSKNINESVSAAYRYTEDTAYDGVDRALREMTAVSEFDEELQSMMDMLATVSDLISDFGRSARGYLEYNSFSEEEFIQIEERLNTVNHLKAKYGKTIEEVLLYGKNLELQYDKLLHQEQYLQNLQGKLADAEKKLEQACRDLSRERKRIAAQLSRNITEALVDLNFMDVRFDMVFEKTEHYSAEGMDYPYFIISTNVGEDMNCLLYTSDAADD